MLGFHKAGAVLFAAQTPSKFPEDTQVLKLRTEICSFFSYYSNYELDFVQGAPSNHGVYILKLIKFSGMTKVDQVVQHSSCQLTSKTVEINVYHCLPRQIHKHIAKILTNNLQVLFPKFRSLVFFRVTRYLELLVWFPDKTAVRVSWWGFPCWSSFTSNPPEHHFQKEIPIRNEGFRQEFFHNLKISLELVSCIHKSRLFCRSQ